MSQLGRRGDNGFVSTENIAIIGLSLVILVAVANFVVLQYARGVVRGALDEGVRIGSRLSTDKPGALVLCEKRAVSDLDGLGTIRREVDTPSCKYKGDNIVATVDFHFHFWLPVGSTWDGTLKASSHKERAPTP